MSKDVEANSPTDEEIVRRLRLRVLDGQACPHYFSNRGSSWHVNLHLPVQKCLVCNREFAVGVAGVAAPPG